MREVKRLGPEHEKDIYRVFLSHGFQTSVGINATRSTFENGSFIPYFLSDPAGLALGVFFQGKLEFVMLTSFERGIAHTRRVYGTITMAVGEVLDMLCATCASREPRVVQHCFLLPDGTFEKFKEVFKFCRLNRLSTRQRELSLPKGVRPTDERAWVDVLYHAVPTVNLNLLELEIA